MASWDPWLNENGALVEFSDSAIPPSKDFFHVFLSPTEIVFRLWKILPPTRPDNHPPPSETRDTYEEFHHDERLRSEITRVAGPRTLEYLDNIINGHLDYIVRLPRNVLIKMFTMLDLEDIPSVSMTCRLFRELCKADELWEVVYKIHNKQPVTQELIVLASFKGWRTIFFTNKLQLQMQLRRVAAKGETAFLTEEPDVAMQN